jgi:hypothetical protein
MCLHHPIPCSDIRCPVTIFAILLISLATRAHSLGRPFIWAEPIAEIPWFGQFPGYEDEEGSEGGSRPHSMRFDPRDPRFQQHPMTMNGFIPQQGMPVMPMMQQGGQFQQVPGYPNGGLVVQQQPGHSVVIQAGQNGQPQVTQVPGMVPSMH